MRRVYLLIIVAMVVISLETLPAEGTSCDTTYPQNFFRVCFFEGTNPATGADLGSENEPSLTEPAPDRAYGFNRDWGSGPIFAGRSDDISGVWRGSISLSGGRYLFTLFVRDGVRLYIDETLVLEQCYPYIAGDPCLDRDDPHSGTQELGTGYHNIRVEWFETSDPWWATTAELRLHWDKVQMPELLTNGSFETGDSSPIPWTNGSHEGTGTFAWVDSGFLGGKSVQITANPNPVTDAWWIQTVTVQPNTDYILSGWIKTENVTEGAGANLGLYNTWTHTEGVWDSEDWTYRTLPFNSGAATEVTVAARLGYWAGVSSGTAWFDGLRLDRVSPVVVDAFVIKSQDVCIAGRRTQAGHPSKSSTS